MRKPRGESVGEQLFGIVGIALVGLLGYGGYSLYRDHFAKPDESCYWLVRGFDNGLWLIDTPSEGSCAQLPFVQAHVIKSAWNADELATLAQKAGRKVCGQIVPMCSK